ncbi:MAG: glycosyltransferase [Acidobacteria bacterium]|nr:glycosyltransferase [Acidobacteriota bacterium]
MNIVLVSYPYLPGLGGVERSVHNLAHFLTARGHKVLVVTHQEEGFPLSLERDGGVRVLRVRIPSPFDRDWPRRVRIRFYDALNGAVLALAGALFRPRIVHCHLINADTRYGEALARRTGAGLVISMRGGETEHWIERRPDRVAYVAALLRRADRVTGVARSLLEQAERLAPGVGSKAEVIPNPADPARIEGLRGAPRLRGGRPYLLFAGRLEDMKDVACLIDGYHRAVRLRPDFPWRLLIAGEGSLGPELERQAAEGPGAEGVEFVGRASYPEALALIAGAELLALPSAFSEGCPNVILEAMALGTPTLVSSLPSLTELVEDGVTGAVFELGDAESLSRRLLEAADDPEGRRAWAERARRKIEREHAPGAILERIERIYREVRP